jgi:hypothetical protein
MAIRSKEPSANAMSHPGVKGHLREIIIRDLLRPLLPADVGLGTGVVVTHWWRSQGAALESGSTSEGRVGWHAQRLRWASGCCVVAGPRLRYSGVNRSYLAAWRRLRPQRGGTVGGARYGRLRSRQSGADGLWLDQRIGNGPAREGTPVFDRCESRSTTRSRGSMNACVDGWVDGQTCCSGEGVEAAWWFPRPEQCLRACHPTVTHSVGSAHPTRTGVHPVLNEPQIQGRCQHSLSCRLTIEMLSVIALGRFGHGPSSVGKCRATS